MNIDEERSMIYMFEAVHGQLTGSAYLEIQNLFEDDETVAAVMKDGNLCWKETKTELMFNYIITKGL